MLYLNKFKELWLTERNSYTPTSYVVFTKNFHQILDAPVRREREKREGERGIEDILAERPNWFHTINWWWATCTSKRWALLEGRGYLWASKVDFWKQPENGHFSAASQRNLKISRPANSLAIPLHWPFLPKSCLTTLKSARSQNAFLSETPIWPLFGHFGPPESGLWVAETPGNSRHLIFMPNGP